MPFCRCALFLLIACSVFAPPATPQEPPRDIRAVAVLQQSVAAMGGTVPSDSLATGSITITAGSTKESGTIRILTRGYAQSAEQIQAADGSRAVIYSGGVGATREGTNTKKLQLELAVTSHSPCFPLVLVAGALNDRDTILQYVGLEKQGGAEAHHVRFWNSFKSTPELQHLAEFSAKDLWIDAVSGLPRTLAFERRAAGGDEPRIPVVVSYSDYRAVRGVLYPYRIERSLNGTPWATITIETVAFNTGLTDAEFAVR